MPASHYQLYIGENIKRLRKQKGITQETLAERMHVSIAAVSKWERNEALPDISMVLPLASYFGVSTDELLGLDAAKTEEKIQEIMKERNRLCALGKEYEAFDLIVSAYKEFPDDWRIVEEYMWKLYYDPNCVEPYGHEVHKEELYRLCERVLDECVVDQVRYSALSILGGLYLLDGPGNDLVAATVLAASGCHIILFTTGRGTPLGGPAPTMKVATNTALSQKKKDFVLRSPLLFCYLSTRLAVTYVFAL